MASKEKKARPAAARRATTTAPSGSITFSAAQQRQYRGWTGQLTKIANSLSTLTGQMAQAASGWGTNPTQQAPKPAARAQTAGSSRKQRAAAAGQSPGNDS